MTPDEPGLLGNLPRSRPGTRSDKRAGGSNAGGPTKAKPASEAKAKPASRTKPAAAKAKPAPAKARPAAKPPPPPPESSNPLHSAVKVAETGLRVAEGVTREVLRRLPRP